MCTFYRLRRFISKLNKTPPISSDFFFNYSYFGGLFPELSPTNRDKGITSGRSPSFETAEGRRTKAVQENN